MSLVYRSVFGDSDGRIATALTAEFKKWLLQKNLRLPEEGLTQRGAALDSDDGSIAFAAELDSRLPNGDRIHRFRLVEESTDARWITTVASVRSDQPSDEPSTGSARIWVDLEHEPTARSAPTQPGSPRIVRELMAVGEGFDGPVPLTAEPLSVTRDHVAEVVSYIVSPDRTVPVIVFAHDVQRAYDQHKLSKLLARDSAGVAAVFVLADPTATERLAVSLPEGYAVYGGAMRTYLPGAVSDPEDVSTRHRILGRASLVALGTRAFPAVKTQVLELSTQRPAPVALRTPSTTAPPAAGAVDGHFVVGVAWLRERLVRIRAVLGGEVPERQDESLAFDEALDTLLTRAAAAPVVPSAEEPPAELETELQRRLEVEEGERRTLEELLTEAQEDIESRAARIKNVETAYDDLTLETIEAAGEIDRLERRVRWLERRMRDLGDTAVSIEDELPPLPESVAEVVLLARQHLVGVELGDIDEEAAALDLHAQAPLYAAKSWGALQALDAYATARSSAQFKGSFFAWCQEPPPGQAAIPATSVAMGESETVDSVPELRSARTFPVPSTVEPSGMKYMPAHVKVVKRGSPAPRLHFCDDVARTGKVYVGYLGAHLPTARFP